MAVRALKAEPLRYLPTYSEYSLSGALSTPLLRAPRVRYWYCPAQLSNQSKFGVNEACLRAEVSPRVLGLRPNWEYRSSE